ncbi:MAG: DUF111 family protein [Candidatus Omnitrophica bacterium]|nr:DUF111 family protein [Candidatus Omnitrophota bacterium]MCM8793865.1 DUF111 family protein [Candidatus Omnitrophota bacterium]
MKIAYFDCFWGMSGDMFLASLIDAGVDFSLFEKRLKSAGFPHFTIEKRKVKKGEISATQILIKVQKRRIFSYLDFKEIIKNSHLPREIKEKSLATFTDLAEAEKKVHGVKTKDFCFAQLGEIDTLVDIVGAYLALDLLEIERVYFSLLRLARGGFFKHGKKKFPLPGPAVLELLKGIPLKLIESTAEYITPTGAVLIKNLFAGDTSQLPPFKIISLGYGAGSINFGSSPNLLRVLLGEVTP